MVVKNGKIYGVWCSLGFYTVQVEGKTVSPFFRTEQEAYNWIKKQ